MSSGPYKVLLVDDSDLVCSMVGQALGDADLEVVRASNGAEAVEAAYREVPDVIVMDAEMPLMPGYLACRILKSRRGVCDIPILMHTSLSEDRDKYWALSSGTDEFMAKDFDQIDLLVERVQLLAAAHGAFDRTAIREDAASIDRNRVFELLGSVLDQQLFQSTVYNLLTQVGRSLDSLPETARHLLELVPKVCESHLSILMIPEGKSPLAFLLPSPGVATTSIDGFLQVCLGDFYPHFPTLNLGALRQENLGLEPSSERGGALKLNSYTSVPLRGRGDLVVGTLHVGNVTNNYFSPLLTSYLDMFARTAGIVLDNAILFNRMAEMQGRVRNAFSKFVPPEIIDQLVESTQHDVRLVGEKREVAVLFSDIRSFTAISENNTAEAVVAFLNRFFDTMVAIIRRHGGTIDKFIGDAILAIFGAPQSYDDNALRATRAAIDMVAALSSVPVEGLVLPPGGLKIGIGIHHGPVIVGNIGSADKFNYTVIGDSVNLASRLEGLTKHYHQDILVSDSVRENLGSQVLLREIDSVRVLGKESVTVVYAVVNDADAADGEFLSEFAKGLRMYRMGNWGSAVDYFRSALARKPSDKPVEMFLSRCSQFLENPPEHWDGAQTLDFK